MSGKVLLINRGMAFLTNALVSSLKNVGVSAVQVGYEPEQVARFEQGADAFLFFAGESEYFPAKLLLHLKDLCADGTKYLCILGYDKDITEIEEVVPQESIACVFRRPADVKTITEELGALFRKEKQNDKETSILLVDDDVTFLRIMQSWLDEKYSVTSVKSGMQAITFIATHTPDLILLDYNMPVTSGPQVLEMIRSEPASAGIPVVFLTGKNDRESVMNAMALKADGYLLKTLGKESILTAVDGYLAKARKEQGEERT